MPWSVRPCGECGNSMGRRHHTAKFCQPCLEARLNGGGKLQARKVVAAAVACGMLPRAASCKCVDCGRQARDYEHRDYSKPLDVVPVCRACNRKRGPGVPVLGQPLQGGFVGADPVVHAANSLAHV